MPPSNCWWIRTGSANRPQHRRPRAPRPRQRLRLRPARHQPQLQCPRPARRPNRSLRNRRRLRYRPNRPNRQRPRRNPSIPCGFTTISTWTALNLDEELARLEEEEQQLSRDFLAVERAPKPQEQLLGQLSARRDPHDESWAEQLLEDPKASPAPPPPPRITPREPAVTPPAAVEPRIEPAVTPLSGDDEAHDDDDDGLHPDFRRHEGDSSLRLSADNETDSEPEEDEREPTFSALPPRARIEEIELTASTPLRSEPALRNESLLNLSEEPLQLDWQQPKKPWGRWIGWSLLNLIGAGALAGQYVSYHFDELARQDQYRPWFEQLCPEIGCKLPSKVDVAQIKSSNLVVRSHPEFNGALVVDAILYNRALFSQPFPLLELRFADMNGQLLASRRFKPGEYLGGELAGQAEMPPQTPIHISLDILDPGAKAVNYSLSFFSPE